MTRDRLHLLAYLAAAVAATLIHSPLWLAGGLVLTILLAGRDAMRLLHRAVRAVLVFNVVISLSYAVMAWLQDFSPWEALLRINLRVVLLTLLTLLFVSRVDLFRALGFSKSLTYILCLAYSQILTFRRAHEDFRLALSSRTLSRPRLIDRYRASAAAASWFVEKSLHAAAQSSQALRSRGFFDD